MSETTNLEPRSYKSSLTIMTELIFPQHANAHGSAFGGQLMAWADMAAGICSMRHTRGTTVTAGVDDFHFDRAIRVGDIVTVQARVNATFRSSLEVEVTVHGESLTTGERWRCVEAWMTFVAIDGNSRPRLVPPLLLESEDDAERTRAANVRREERLRRRSSPR